MSLGVEVRCVVAAPPLPEARLERTLLVALIAFTFDRLACDRPLTLAACQPLYPRPTPTIQGGAWTETKNRIPGGGAGLAACDMRMVPPRMNRRGPGPDSSRSQPAGELKLFFPSGPLAPSAPA